MKSESENPVKVKVAQSCPTLCYPMDYIAHGILQARILERVAVPFSRGSSQPRSPTLQADSLPAEPPGKPKNTGDGYPIPSPADLPDLGIEPGSPELQVDSSPAELLGKPKSTGAGSPSLFQQIFWTQESNWSFRHCRRILYQLNHQGIEIKPTLKRLSLRLSD